MASFNGALPIQVGKLGVRVGVGVLSEASMEPYPFR